MRTFIRFLLIVFVGFGPLLAGTQSSLPWSGYIQARYSDNLQDKGGFSIRRAKLWTQGQTPFNTHFNYKVQAVFRWQNSGALDLQDMYLEYQTSLLKWRFGQMVPDFSLQWNQPDARLPLVERAAVVDALIPGAETLGRDIGTMLLLESPSNAWHASAGVFNGSGANQSGYARHGYAITSRAYYVFGAAKGWQLHLGGSLLLRDQPTPIAKKIFGTNQMIDGKDLRSGLEGQFLYKRYGLQTEYLAADLDGQHVDGYYARLHYQINQALLLDLSTEKFNDINPASADSPWYILGINYFNSGYKARAMFDFRTQDTAWSTHYRTTIQYQLYFN